MKFVCSIIYYMFMKVLNEKLEGYRRAPDEKGNDIYSKMLFPIKVCKQWFNPEGLLKKKKDKKTSQKLYDEHFELVDDLREKLSEWIDILHELMMNQKSKGK